MRKFFVDANIFLRFLTKDDPAKWLKCEELFRQATLRKVLLITSAVVIAEVIWVLLSFYGYSKLKIIPMIEGILNTPNLEMEAKEILRDSLTLWETEDIDFIDAYNAIWMGSRGIEEVFSYDEDFDQVSMVKRFEP